MAGVQGVLFYTVAYAFMNLGAFAVVAALQRRPGVTSQIATFAGLGYRAPVLALTMTVFLLSLTGIPPLAGFFAKAIVVLGALEVGGDHRWLAVIMMLNAAAAAFYYLRVVVVHVHAPAGRGRRPVSIGLPTRVGLVLAATLTIVIGLLPAVTQAVLDWTEAAAVALAPRSSGLAPVPSAGRPRARPSAASARKRAASRGEPARGRPAAPRRRARPACPATAMARPLDATRGAGLAQGLEGEGVGVVVAQHDDRRAAAAPR